MDLYPTISGTLAESSCMITTSEVQQREHDFLPLNAKADLSPLPLPLGLKSFSLTKTL